MFDAQIHMVWFAEQVADKQMAERLARIKLIICDVDGSLTDDHILLSDDGSNARSFSVFDGYAMTKMADAGINLAWLTGNKGTDIERRAQRLGIKPELLFMGRVEDKATVVAELQKFSGLAREEIMVYGNDIPDYKASLAAGFFAVPRNTPFYLHPVADLIIPAHGGYGAMRLLLDLVLFIQKKHFAQGLVEKALAKL